MQELSRPGDIQNNSLLRVGECWEITGPEEVIRRVRRMIEELNIHQPGLGRHSRDATRDAFLFSEYIGMGEEFENDGVAYAVGLHDAGKLWIPRKLLTKGGNLTDEEKGVMQRHAEFSGMRINFDPDLACLFNIVVHVHEHWDGSGYPEGLKGEAIPFWARVIGIADTWDAMTHSREYKEAFSTAKSLGILLRSSPMPHELMAQNGIMFDPDLVREFVRYCRDEKKGREVMLGRWRRGGYDGSTAARLTRRKTFSEVLIERGYRVEQLGDFNLIEVRAQKGMD